MLGLGFTCSHSAVYLYERTETLRILWVGMWEVGGGGSGVGRVKGKDKNNAEKANKRQTMKASKQTNEQPADNKAINKANKTKQDKQADNQCTIRTAARCCRCRRCLCPA